MWSLCQDIKNQKVMLPVCLMFYYICPASDSVFFLRDLTLFMLPTDTYCVCFYCEALQCGFYVYYKNFCLLHTDTSGGILVNMFIRSGSN